MKQSYFLSILSFFVLGAGASSATAARPAPADTLRGQHRFIQQVSATMCERLQAENEKRPLASLAPVDAQSILAAITESSMLAHAEDMGTLMTTNQVSSPRKAGEKLGVDIMIHLMESCPAGQQMMLGVVNGQLGQKLPISEAEKPVLLLVTDDICSRLNTENAARPLSGRTVEERRTAILAALQGGMLKNMEPLANFYGLNSLKNNKLMETTGQKIALLMLQQCPVYIMQIGVDQYLKRK